MNEPLKLTFTDSHNDTVAFHRSEVTNLAYVSVNGEVQVRLSEEQQKEASAFLTPHKEPVCAEVDPDVGMFYLLRQRKDNPLKIKVMFAGVPHARFYTSRAKAEEGKRRMTDQHGTKFTFTVVKEVK